MCFLIACCCCGWLNLVFPRYRGCRFEYYHIHSRKDGAQVTPLLLAGSGTSGSWANPKAPGLLPSRSHCVRFRNFSLSKIPDLSSKPTSANFTHMRSWAPSLLSVCSKGRLPPHQHLTLNFLSYLIIAPAWNWWPSLIVWTWASAHLWVALCILLLPTADQEFALSCCLDM